MRISYNWLKEIVPVTLTPQQVCDTLIFLGFETTVASAAGQWAGVVTARVTAREKHPQADKLSLCTVTDGTNTYPVVCGAANVAAGQTIALARIGAELPGNFLIKKAKIRGVESQGMICSAAELGLAAESDGIMVLPDATPLGIPLEQALGGVDTILNVEITTNRGDALSHWGVARELSAKLAVPVALPAIERSSVAASFPVEITAADLCPRYIGMVIEGVTVRPSPDWMARRLEACGIRPINNIVDVTNYVLLELGHPLHAFDLRNLAGGRIVVRRAAAGESITALDGKHYSLTDRMLVIADGEKPQAIAGVMGGEHSGVAADTATVVLESALFAPTSIRTTSKKLALSTDASYRFERGCGWDVAEIASWRAAQLICELAGGRIAARSDAVAAAYTPVTVSVRTARVRKLLGLDVPAAEISAILSRLGMQVLDTPEGCSVTVPSWRRDISQEADLIEEVARIKGYEHVPETVLPIVPDLSEGKARPAVMDAVYARLTALGFCEALNYSFVEGKDLAQFGLSSPHAIANPLSKEYELLRPSLLPGLWKNLKLNLAQGYADVRLYEWGTVFTPPARSVAGAAPATVAQGRMVPGSTLVPSGESRRLGILLTGAVWGDWWRWYGKDVPQAADLHFLAGLLANVLSDRKWRIAENKQCQPYFHPGKTARLDIAGVTAGEFGVLRPDHAQALGCGEVLYAELDCDVLSAPAGDAPREYAGLKRFPPVNLDLSLVADASLALESITRAIARCAEQGLSIDTRLIDVYADAAKLGAGKVSYTLHLVIRHAERTLSDKDTQALLSTILSTLEKKLSVTLRK